MIKTRNITPRSFINAKFFPGTVGNPFDRLLHSLDKFEQLPSLVMIVLLTLLVVLGSLPAYLLTHTLPTIAVILPFFFITDWILISLLPKTISSFGPVKIVVLMLACLRVPFAWLPLDWNYGFESAGTLLILYGFFIEPFCLDVHRETFLSHKLVPGKTLRVLHLGDLHMERITRREKKILQKAIELAPDLILFSGDVLNLSYLKDVRSQSEAIWFFRQLSAPLGVFAVTGSPAVDYPDFFAKFCTEAQTRWLNNEASRIDTPAGQINLIGLTCSHNPDLDEVVLTKTLQSTQKIESGVNLLLYHSPDLAPSASQHGIDLQLSGHTHGGQVRLPILGPIYTGSLYGRLFQSGRYLVNNMTLFITRGIGMEGAIAPRVRFLCPPQITLWSLTGN